MNSCSLHWMHIKLTLLCSVSGGEGLAVSRLACKCGPPFKGHLHRLKRTSASFYTEQSHSTVHADIVATHGDLKSP